MIGETVCNVIRTQSEEVLINLEEMPAVPPMHYLPAGIRLRCKGKGLNLYVSDCAQKLRKYGRDVLSGDFRVFIAIDQSVKL